MFTFDDSLEDDIELLLNQAREKKELEKRNMKEPPKIDTNQTKKL
jgi:hypothetical protein